MARQPLTTEEKKKILAEKILKFQKQRSDLEKRQAAEERKLRAHLLIQLGAKTFGNSYKEASEIILKPEAHVDVYVNGKKLQDYLTRENPQPD